MSMGYTEHSFGYRPAPPRPPRPVAARRPDNRPGPFGPSPAFPSLAHGNQLASQLASPQPTFSRADINRSIAANPQAAGANGTPFSYQGPQQMPQQAAPPPNPAPVPGNVAYDYNTDPILQQIQSLGTRNRGDAQAAALAARKQLAIDYNDTALANQLGDTGTAQAAAGNPFGVLERLKYDYQHAANDLDNQLSNQNNNLYYSSYRGQQQGNLAHQYEGQQAAAAGQEQGLLGQIGSGLAAALAAADLQDANAQADAKARAVQAALNNGVDPGAFTDVNASAPPPPPPPPPGAGFGGTSLGGDVPSFDPSTIFPTPGTPLIGAFVPPPPPPPAAGVPQGVDPLLWALSQQNRRKPLGGVLG